MHNGGPPSSRPYLAANPALLAARGLVREGLGGLQNLDRLLGSRRVGPKSLSAVLPDVVNSFGPWRTALGDWIAGTSSSASSRGAGQSLEEFVRPRLDELEKALAAASDKPMNARNRLHLGEVVSRVTPELEAVRGLVDLLEESSWAPSMRVSLEDLVRDAFPSDAENAEAGVRVFLPEVELDVEVSAKPRALTNMLLFASSWVAVESALDAVVLSFAPPRALGLQAGNSSGRVAALSRKKVVAPTLECLELAAAQSGVVLVRAGSVLTLTLAE
jgi:hypothetical protein